MFNCNYIFLALFLYFTLCQFLKLINLEIEEFNNGILLILDENVNNGMPIIVKMRNGMDIVI